MKQYEDRGMVKWAPYQSLVEHGQRLAALREEKSRIPRPQISSEKAEEINDILTHYEKEPVKAEYWENGHLYSLLDTISKIDPLNHFLDIGGKEIPFPNLIGLELV